MLGPEVDRVVADLSVLNVLAIREVGVWRDVGVRRVAEGLIGGNQPGPLIWLSIPLGGGSGKRARRSSESGRSGKRPTTETFGTVAGQPGEGSSHWVKRQEESG